MVSKRKLLWVADTPAPLNVRQAVADDWEIVSCPSGERLDVPLSQASIAVVHANGASKDPARLENLLNAVGESSVVALVLLPIEAQAAWAEVSRRKGQFLCVRQDATPMELASKLAAAEALQPAFHQLREELSSVRNSDSGPYARMEEMDEEMRLAARLQRDFLPRRLPEVGQSRFAVLYRPATWVSGDIYDIVRLDETHVGFYVADAVGHGMPAALLTMFIKKALQMKRIVGHTYELVTPHVSLGELNTDICDQNLSSCQFCTAVYCVLDTATMMLTYSRAGHPEPVLIHADGRVETLQGPGSLLGVFPDEQFESQQTPLQPGDRLVLYTDGAEPVLGWGVNQGERTLEDIFSPWVSVPREEMLLQLAARIDEAPRTDVAEDDITICVMDVEEAA